MIQVRIAELTDAAGITRVHCSDIDQWAKTVSTADGGLESIEAPWEELTPGERWNHGGPWMSPELCTIHLNRLRLLDQFPLVADVDGQIAGELELIVGHDAEHGINANLSVLYVDKTHQGQGIGSVLMGDALELAHEIGCQTLTTYQPAAPDFYRRFGLEPMETYQEVIIPTSAATGNTRPARRVSFPQHEVLASYPLLFGRILSSYHTWLQLAGEREPGLYAIPMHNRPAAMDISIRSAAGRTFVSLRDLTGRYEEAAVHAWGPEYDHDVVTSILAYAKRQDIQRLRFLASGAVAQRLRDEFPANPGTDVVVYGKRL